MKEQFQIDQQTSKYAGQQQAVAEPGTASFNQGLKLSGPTTLTLNMQTSDMNDANKEEPSRYSALKECAHVVDLDLDAQAEPSVVRDAGGAWERVR